jgi:REP element-mobilizing transposase RayT
MTSPSSQPERGRLVRDSPLRPTAEWHSRGRTPHWEAGDVPQSVIFRLADSLPKAVLESKMADETSALRRGRFESLLDAGHGEGVLARSEVGAIVEGALLHFDGARYALHAWCVMPNHVHVLFTPASTVALSSIVHSWKSFTAKAINVALGRQGRLWCEEYFDRAIRDGEHFERARSYIEENPVKAGLCTTPADWPSSSARMRPEG